MSGLLPTTPAFRTVNLVSGHVTLSSKAQSGKRQVRKIDAHVWSFTAKYAKLTRAQFMPVYAFCLAQKGKFESFTVIPPDLSTPQGPAGGTPLVNGASQTGNTLIIDGGTASKVGWMLAGDVFSVAGNTKVHMLIQNADTGAGGTVTLVFEPDLPASPANNAALTVSNVPFTMMFNNDIQEYSAIYSPHFTFEIDLEEVL